MKLTRKAVKFLKCAASAEGACCWDESVPAMRNEEMATIEGLVSADTNDDRVGVVWHITDLGRAALNQEELR